MQDKCESMPLYTNKEYGGRCERDGSECKHCIELDKKNKASKKAKSR